MEKDNNILEKMNKEPGFSVPENYFENFASNLMESLPENQFEQEGPKMPTMWQRVRPIFYMAAMFIGITLMLKIFISTDKTTSDNKETVSLNEPAESSIDDVTIEDYIYSTSVNDFAVYEYLYDQYADAE